MENLIKLKKDYQINDDYLKIRTNHREQIMSLYFLHQLTGETETDLINSYLDLVLPLPQDTNDMRYKSISTHRCMKRKHLNWLIREYLEVKPILKN